MEEIRYKYGKITGRLKPLQKIINVGFGVPNGKQCFWFDKYGILNSDSTYNAWRKGIENAKEHYDLFSTGKIFDFYKVVFEDGPSSHMIYFLRMISAGETYDDIQNRLLTETPCFAKRQITEADLGFITKIGRPKFERVPENKNKATFDFVKVSVFVTKQENTNALIKQHQSEIYDRIKDRIQDSRSFKKYGVPVNFLKCTSAEHFSDGEIEFIFELKTA